MSTIPSPVTSYANCACVKSNVLGSPDTSACAMMSAIKSTSTSVTSVAGLPITSAIALISVAMPATLCSVPCRPLITCSSA